MFGIGFFELVILFVIALVVLGPEKLPQMIRAGVQLYTKIRNTITKVQNGIEEDLSIVETRKKMQAQIDKIAQKEQEIDKALQQLQSKVEK